jgi:hypothetical protein
MTTSDIVSGIINLLRKGSDGIGGDWGCDEAVEAVQKLVAASPAPDTGREWRVDGIPSGTVARYVTDATGNYGIAFVYGNTQEEADQHATQIVADHNAVGLLVEALKAARKYIDAGYQPPELIEQIDAALAATGRQP